MNQPNLFDIPASLSREEWLERARQVAQDLALHKGSVTADDIHDALPIPKGIDGRIMGKVFDGMKCVGYEKSRREICHHRPLGRFTLSETEFVDRLSTNREIQG